jgi:hypothetical protein
VGILLLSINGIVNSSKANNVDDFDPLVDVSVTVEIQAIRFLEAEKTGLNTEPVFFKNIRENYRLSPFLDALKKIFDNKVKGTLNKDNNPSFYVKVFINDAEFVSDVWDSVKYIYEPDWTATFNVPDEKEFVDIKIQLWSSIGENKLGDMMYDISGDSTGIVDQYDVEITYSIKNGTWTGDDKLKDSSGYGRLCGCDDGTIYQEDRDSELWFNIYQNDYDGDGIPYWTELNDYSTGPEVKNYGDPDNDGIPVEWEYKWGYNPFEYENHKKIDPEQDSINNYEEYLTSEWYSDPFRKDVFVELDLMEEGPNGEKSYFPENAGELITTAFNRQNIVFHLDAGDMNGHEIIPFEENVDRADLIEFYYNYFLHGNENNWRYGVFHYGVVVYTSTSAAGYMFRPNAFQVSSRGHENLVKNKGYDRDIVYGSAYMHELGHTFGFWPIPGHTRTDNPLYWLWVISYKSCMNYEWMYKLVDYSDGSRRRPDIDDWNRIDYNFFERGWG